MKLRMRPPLVIAVIVSLSIAHDLRIDPFACGQLYTALSRVVSIPTPPKMSPMSFITHVYT